MRHRTALPFLDAFLKPTKHIRSGLFLHYMVCNFCEKREKQYSFSYKYLIKLSIHTTMIKRLKRFHLVSL